MNMTVVYALAAIALAFFAGLLTMRNKASKDIKQAIQLASEAQAEETSHLYSSLLVVNGYGINEDNKVVKQDFPPHVKKEADKFLHEIGLLED